MAVNTPRDKLMTMDDDALNKLLKAGYIDYGEFHSILKCRQWSANVDAKKKLKNVRYSHNKIIIIGGLSRKGKSAVTDAIFNKYDNLHHKVGEINDKWMDGFIPG